jgi:hypothetical protein
MRRIPYERLRRVWCNSKFTTDEVAAILLISETQLRQLAALHRLPKRHFVQRNQAANDEPDAAEKAAQAARMAECRESHIRQRMSEPVASTQSKVSKWRQGVCQPREGSHVS